MPSFTFNSTISECCLDQFRPYALSNNKQNLNIFKILSRSSVGRHSNLSRPTVERERLVFEVLLPERVLLIRLLNKLLNFRRVRYAIIMTDHGGQIDAHKGSYRFPHISEDRRCRRRRHFSRQYHKVALRTMFAWDHSCLLGPCIKQMSLIYMRSKLKSNSCLMF